MSFKTEFFKYIFLSGALFFALFGLLIILDFTPMRVKERNRVTTSILCFSVSVVSFINYKIYALLYVTLAFFINNENSEENRTSIRNSNVYRSMLENDDDDFRRNSNMSKKSENQSINYINSKN